MKRLLTSIFLSIVSTFFVFTAVSAVDLHTPWFLPWFSKDQHLYICGPVEAYGLTQQQVDEVETDLDRLSCICGINLYFSVISSDEMDAKSLDGYTGLLLERWSGNQLPKANRAITTVCMQRGLNGPQFITTSNYYVSSTDTFTALLSNARYRFLDGKPYLYPYLNYITLATENSEKEKISPDELAQNTLCWQKHLEDKQASTVAIRPTESTAESTLKIAKARESDKPKQDKQNNFWNGVKDVALMILSVIAGLELIVLLATRRSRW